MALLRTLTCITACLAGAFAAPMFGLAAEPVSFDRDVQPILTARGCNQGACHGKQRGQNGFQLSLLGFDSDFDHEALAMNARGRRIFPAAPDRSLLLQKATAIVPHGGGKRIDADGADYELIHRWIAEGAARSIPNEPTLVGIEVVPADASLRPNATTQLKITAEYSDGSKRDVTSRTSFQSNEAAIASVSSEGEIKAGPITGETAIMSRYCNFITVTNVLIPRESTESDDYYAALPRNNFIDDHIYNKLQSLGIRPSQPADDATFLRRVHIDLIGRLPTAEETRAFLDSENSSRREALVDSLLNRPEYADHWANQWADLLRPNPYRVGIKATMVYDNWIRDQFRRNQPYDKFVSELVTAKGSTWHNGAVTLFRDRRSPDEVATMVSQLFLGVRLECAKCHHHPFEKWGQDDFYSFAAYFARVGRKGRGVSPPISGDEEMIFPSTKGTVKHPITGEVLPPRPLFGEAASVEELADPREALVGWMTGDGSEYFSRVQANRVWATLMGRGIVEPVDDLRSTNPPTNEALLSALAAHFRESKYDLKSLLRTIVLSQAYSLDSLPNETNAADTRNYSRYYRQRLRAEVLLGAVDDITGSATSFSAMPADSRPQQIWTTRIDSLFLDTFGRPNENEDPPCERQTGSTVTQTLHLMNSPALHRKVIGNDGVAAKLASSDRSTDELVAELYLLIYNRLPAPEERAIGRKIFDAPDVDRRQVTEDLMWALLNTPEFVFKD